jgi:hypothetical protein
LALGGAGTISFNDFHGTAALLNLEMWGGVDITGNGSSAQILGLGLERLFCRHWRAQLV